MFSLFYIPPTTAVIFLMLQSFGGNCLLLHFQLAFIGGGMIQTLGMSEGPLLQWVSTKIWIKFHWSWFKLLVSFWPHNIVGIPGNLATGIVIPLAVNFRLISKFSLFALNHSYSEGFIVYSFIFYYSYRSVFFIFILVEVNFKQWTEMWKLMNFFLISKRYAFH